MRSTASPQGIVPANRATENRSPAAFFRFALPALALLAIVGAGCRRPAPPPKRVVLLTLDTLRADHLGCYGYPRKVSPFLDQIAAEGAFFTNAYATSSTTVASHASIFTSLFPAQHQLIRNGETLHDSVFTMAQAFQDQGYQTAAFSTVGFIKSLDRGFDVFDTEKKFFPASHVAGKAKAWIADRRPDERFFVWVHLFDVHQWIKREHLDPEFNGKARGTTSLSDDEMVEYLAERQGIHAEFFGGRGQLFDVIDRYDDQIMSLDAAVRDFSAFFDGRGLRDGTLWVITADHGEGLGSHRFRGHGAMIFNEQIRIPLILYSTTDPRFSGQVVDRLVRHVDLLPTMADLVGLDVERQVFPVAGKSLLPLVSGREPSFDVRYTLAQRWEADDRRVGMGWEPGLLYTVLTQDHKYIFHESGQDEFYDLRQDPTESRNLIDQPSPIRDRICAEGTRIYEAFAEQGAQLGRTEILPEHVEELKALGYL